MLAWFEQQYPPLYLAPMAGVTDIVFRRICKEYGADVLVTEFVSAEGILQRDDRTRHYTEFDEQQRPVGVQLFGANGKRMGEAARKIIDWKQPDFIDINFGCPVNKVVAKNGGSSLLKDCPLLQEVASEIVAAVKIPVTAKIRIGWDANQINAIEVAKRLEDVGVQAIAVHGRTRAQGYSGEADWDVIARVAEAVRVPVIGNGDLQGADQVKKYLKTTQVKGFMIGRAAMSQPWIFSNIKNQAYGVSEWIIPTLEQRLNLIRRHCVETLAWHEERMGERREFEVIRSMRSRLMHYTKSLPHGKFLRNHFAQLGSLTKLEDLLSEYLIHHQSFHESTNID